MKLKEIVADWVAEEFRVFNIGPIIRGYEDGYVSYHEFTYPDYEHCIYPACETIWVVKNEEWIRNNIERVFDCGFRVFSADEVGLFIGTDFTRPDKIASCFVKLYRTKQKLAV